MISQTISYTAYSLYWKSLATEVENFEQWVNVPQETPRVISPYLPLKKNPNLSILSDKLDVAFKCYGLLKRADNIPPLWLNGIF